MQYNYSSLLSRDAAPKSHQVRQNRLRLLNPPLLLFIQIKYFVVFDWFKAPLVILHNQPALTKFGRCKQFTIDSMVSWLRNEID